MGSVINNILLEEEIEFEGDEREDILYSDIDIVTIPIDFSIETIYNHVKQGIIEIPQFQRNFVWSIKQSSEFIDSIFRGFPIPPVFLYEKGKNKFLIIDGQQRLLTIFLFIENKFPKENTRAQLRTYFNRQNIKNIKDFLVKKDYFLDFKLKFDDIDNPRYGKTYNDMDEEDREAFRLKYIRAIIIKKISENNEVKIIPEVFKRLNYGGIKLTPQEIRVALYYSSFFEMLFNIVHKEETSILLGFKTPHAKMRDIEILLRSLAFLLKLRPEELKTGKLGEYSPPLRSFLDRFACESTKLNKKEINFMENLVMCFIKKYSKLIKDAQINPFKEGSKFKILLFEVVFFWACIGAWRNKNIDDIKVFDINDIKKIADNKEFKRYSVEGTAQTNNVINRFNIAKRILKLNFY